MVKIEPKTIKMFTTTEEELIEKMVGSNHAFRKLNSLIAFEELISPYRELYSTIGKEGVDVIKGFKTLLIQFWENYSDREMEKVLQENVAVKWFCGFGLIDKLAVTPANVLDPQVLENICPNQGMVFMDKLYDTKKANSILIANNCASGIIRKNNNKRKNRDLDKWRSKTRMPFESTFSKLNHHARYRSKVKVLFQCFSEAITNNLKKAIRFLPDPTGD